MRKLLRLLPLTFVGACANACALSKALYLAVVHNSGAPPRAERDSMDARERVMLRAGAKPRIIIYPVAVLGRATEYDSSAAVDLARQLTALGMPARVAVRPVELPYERQPNEALTLWTRFRALSDSVRRHPVLDADYLMYVDVFGARAFAVHVMTTTANGEMAYRRAWNSHQPLYKEVQPSSIADAIRMVALDIQRSTK